ncbi:MAG: hypothetical protein FWE02_02470 [Defluviitaleaceae bacterium]|nr:hypothetical protein [Defluviitaleaceae bacterium]
MENKKLNRMIPIHFPNLESTYFEEISWQEGENTGSHVIYGDVLTPYIVECIENKNENEIKKIFDFIEEILSFNDKYAEEVVTLSIFESILYLFDNNRYILDIIGQKSEEILNELYKF